VSGIAAVEARIAELRSTLGLVPAPAAAPARSAGGAAFAGALDAVSARGGDGPAPAPGRRTGADAVDLARTFTGVPYLWGGTDPERGLDCSGLTQLVFRRLGVELPRVAADQARSGEAVPSLAQARPGDLVFFGTPAHHVGIYAGDGKMIDAPRAGKTVGLHPLHGTPSAIRRMLPPEAAAGALPAPALPATAGVSGASGASGGGQANAALARVPFSSLFAASGARHGVDPALLAAVARTESSFDPSARSPAGARGLMQLMPGTARSLGVDPLAPAQAVDGAARLLKQLLGRYDGRVDLALAGYNAGPGAVDRHGGIPPYKETRDYVQRVTTAWEAYR
jgi:hypothetical protein